MIAPQQLDSLDAQQMRQALLSLMAQVAAKDELLDRRQREVAFAEQASLLEETLDADIAQACAEIERANVDGKSKDKKDKQIPKREPLPAHLPRRDVHHEPESTECSSGCQMKRIGQDVSEKLDDEPGVFTVDRHVRGKWACAHCQKLVQAPVAAHIIDKGIPTAGLLAQVLVAKFLDHLPLYRQEHIFKRAGLAISRSTLAGVQLRRDAQW